MYISCQQHIPKNHEQHIINDVQQAILTGVQILTFSNIYPEYRMMLTEIMNINATSNIMYNDQGM
jgi:hypothetical protein